MWTKVSSSYEHALAEVFHRIDNRGMLVDTDKLSILDKELSDAIIKNCQEISQAWNCHVFVGRANDDGSSNSVNLNSTSGEKALIKKLKDIGFKVPKLRKKNPDTKEIEYKESTNELILRRIFAETNDENIKKILAVRELNKVKTTYVNARLCDNVYYCIYSVTGTVTGRRSSKKHIFNLGNNAQNWPKHSWLGPKFRECIIARPGHIFFSVDQISAEEWPVSALARNLNALDELTRGVNRHRRLAAFVFGKPEDSITKDSMEYYLGKKTRHANNYGMREQRMSEELTKEGYAIPKEMCKFLLEKVNQYDPSVKGVFHEYIKSRISASRTLNTPLGRERQFFGFRPNDENYELWNEAFSYIPQSTVADNTGLAILLLDSFGGYILQDGHDSILQEVKIDNAEISNCYKNTSRAFERTIRFDNGIDIKIPIEAEIGFDLGHMVKVKEFSEDCVIDTSTKLLRDNAEKVKEKLA